MNNFFFFENEPFFLVCFEILCKSSETSKKINRQPSTFPFWLVLHFEAMNFRKFTVRHSFSTFTTYNPFCNLSSLPFTLNIFHTFLFCWEGGESSKLAFSFFSPFSQPTFLSPSGSLR